MWRAFLHNQWNEWSLTQWLDHFERRTTQEIQLGLNRIRSVAKKMELLDPKSRVITVTGTNGKGSTVAALEAIYQQAGYQVGAYTSPHLVHFNERIRLNKKPVTDKVICSAFRAIENAREDIVLTYFEMATLASLWVFQQFDVDVLILEVGIGGRLDATNIINPDASIITTVALDHQEYLGTTLEAIGFEKAGIIRKGKPLIYADFNPPSTVLDTAEQMESPNYLYSKDYEIEEQTNNWIFQFQNLRMLLPKPRIQLKSAAAALCAVSLLQHDLPVTHQQIELAMKDLFVAGRLQLIHGEVDVLYDVAHNPQSAALLAATVSKLDKKRKVHAIFSALKDKDIFGLILPLKDCVDLWYPAQLETKRASDAMDLLSKFREAEIFLDICYNSPLVAFKTALEQAETGDLIVVYGSFYTVGQVMAAQHNLFEQKEIQ